MSSLGFIISSDHKLVAKDLMSGLSFKQQGLVKPTSVSPHTLKRTWTPLHKGGQGLFVTDSTISKY